MAELDDSMLMDDTVIDVERDLVRSKIGKGSKILNANALLPKGERSRSAKTRHSTSSRLDEGDMVERSRYHCFIRDGSLQEA